MHCRNQIVGRERVLADQELTKLLDGRDNGLLVPLDRCLAEPLIALVGDELDEDVVRAVRVDQERFETGDLHRVLPRFFAGAADCG